MAASNVEEKEQRRGQKVNSMPWSRVVPVMAKVVSYLKMQRKPTYILKLPLSKRIGKVFYTVQSTIEPVTFTKKKDAEQFKELLNKSTGVYQPDIVRREVVDEGYNVE